MSGQMLLFDEVDLDDDDFIPAEVIQHEGYTASIYPGTGVYYPKPCHFHAWLHEVDERLPRRFFHSTSHRLRIWL